MMTAADFSGWYQSDKVLGRVPQYILQQWPEKSVCADAVHHIDYNVVSIDLLYQTGVWFTIVNDNTVFSFEGVIKLYVCIGLNESGEKTIA